MVWLLRFFLLFLVIFFFYMLIKIVFASHRKIDSARRQKRFLLIDYADVRKNFLVTYKGALFAGEKYVGPTHTTSDVVSITIWPQNITNLKELSKEDFDFIENKILKKYSNAEIIWKSSVQEFSQKK